MYERDMPLMRDHALASPDGLLDVVTFVLLTIQQPISRVDVMMADVRKHGAASKHLVGAKREGRAYAEAHKVELWEAVTAALETDDVVAAIEALMAVPNLGMVKAAFVAQICGFEVACLDTHNLAALGIKQTAVKVPKKLKPETLRAKIAAYVELCRATGGAAYWWNRWCDFVAGRPMTKALRTGDEVSAFHVKALFA